jgi:nitrogen fixation/metabolism regulation signal transduction histidine kinase
MVNEFRDYARTPKVTFEDVDLNALIDEILVLYESGQNQQYMIRTKLSPLPRIWADAQQLRQVLLNLVKNAIEAHPQTGSTLPTIDITTEQHTLQSGTLIPAQAVKLTIRDNGSGFPEHILARMFEPYNSNKTHGTGLGLPIVKKIMDAHHAQINVKNVIEKTSPHTIMGAQIDILFVNIANKDAHKETTQLL